MEETWVQGKWDLFRNIVHDVVDNPFFEWTILLLIFASRFLIDLKTSVATFTVSYMLFVIRERFTNLKFFAKSTSLRDFHDSGWPSGNRLEREQIHENPKVRNLVTLSLKESAAYVAFVLFLNVTLPHLTDLLSVSTTVYVDYIHLDYSRCVVYSSP
jgi:hypothetical protein